MNSPIYSSVQPPDDTTAIHIVKVISDGAKELPHVHVAGFRFINAALDNKDEAEARKRHEIHLKHAKAFLRDELLHHWSPWLRKPV